MSRDATNESALARLASGVQVGGWVVDWCLGVGGMGAVYRCHRPEAPEVPRALKMVDAGLDARFVAELDALRTLDHPGIVRLVDTGAHRGEPWLVMDLVRGRPLTALRTDPPVDASVALGIVHQIADALAHAHAHGVSHGDVRPANVLVDADGTAVLVDFGLASDHIGDRPEVAAATLRYAPPEWFTGAADPGAADVYALGVVAWELATGRVAFDRVPPAALPEAKRISLDAATLPGAARELLRAMTAPDAADRPTVAAVVAAVAPWAAARVPRPAPTLPSRLPDTTPHPDRLGRYLVRGELGRGGMGVVLDGWDPELGRGVALKQLPVLPGDPSANEARFRREIELLARLDHPGIVRVLDAGLHDGRLFYAMERIPGPDLAAVIAERGLVAPEVAVGWVLDVASALAASHERGIVHRDVKPSNILLDASGRALLADFGLAMEASRDTRLTRMGQILGTPQYMAPEQASGSRVGPAADQFALGVVLYELVTGRVPAEGDHAVAIAHSYRRGVPRADRVTPAVPAELGRVCARCLAPDPADRYPSMHALVEDLRAVRSGGRASRPGVRRRLARVVRGRGVAVAVAAAALGAAGVAGAGWWASSGEDAAEVAAVGRLEAVRRVIAARREAGDEAGALAAFLGFVELAENRGTRPLARAWLDRAAWAGEAGDETALADALAQAWITADHPEEDVAVLRALGELLWRRPDLDHLAAVVAALEALGAEGVAPLAAAVQVGARDFDAAADPALAGVLSRLSAATELDRGAAVVVGNHDIDGDGTEDVLVIADRRLRTAATGDLALAHLVPVDIDVTPVTYARAITTSAGSTLVVRSDREVSVYGLGVGAPVLRDRWEDAAVGGATAIDLDDNGIPETVVGTRYPTRHLVAVGARVDGTWRRFDPLPPSGAANSGTMILEAGDFDGDGLDELVHARTAFGGYDLRMIRPGAPPRVVGRTSIGDQRGGMVIRGASRRRALVVRADQWGSQQVFPADAPFGPIPPGLHLFDWGGEGFEVAWSLSPSVGSCDGVRAADVDGDGVDEVFANCSGHLVVARQRTDGGLDHAWLEGLKAFGSADLDGDGDDEMVVLDQRDGRWWTIGAGEGHLPRIERPEPAVVGQSRAGAARAEDLLALGLLPQAVSRFERLAEQTTDASEQAALLDRAGKLREKAEPSRAAALYVRSARAGNPAGWERAAAAHQAAVALPEALEAARGGVADPRLSQGSREGLHALVTGLGSLLEGPRADRDLAKGLDGWVVAAPLQAAHDPGAGTLEVRAIGDRELARVPLTWDGGALYVDIDLVLRRMEWGANLVFRLEPAHGGAGWSLRLSGMGGGGMLRVQAACEGRDGALGKETIPVERADLDAPIRLRMLVDGPRTKCGITGLPRPSYESVPAVDVTPGEWALVVQSASPGAAAMASVGIRRITVYGASDRAFVASGPDHLAAQRPELALEELVTATGPEVELWRVHALDQLGDEVEADRAFVHWANRVGPPGLLAMAPVLLRGGSARMSTRLAAALGDQLPEAWLGTWQTLMGQQPHDPVWMRALVAYPRVLADPGPERADLRIAVHRLLVGRGRAWRTLGGTARAEADLHLAIALADAGAGSGAAARRELAAVLGSRGEVEPAFDLLEQAIEAAPAPEITAQSFLVAPELEPLRAHPRWQAIREASLR